ncbi:MAG: hypothetical protein AAF351_02340 [Pseudomonadota bacterium]
MDEENTLPESLVEKLRATDQDTSMITARVDREISETAAAQFKGRVRRRRSLPVWLATAASVLLAVFLVTNPFQDPLPTFSDHDGSGAVDIADVMALARRGDTAQADLDAFALQIVALGDSE